MLSGFLDKTWKSLRILFWKNLVIRTRSKVLTILELFFPLLISVILAIVRHNATIFNYDNCHIQSVVLPSLGSFPYLQSILCNFNYTCHRDEFDPPYAFSGSSKLVQSSLELFKELDQLQLSTSLSYPIGETLETSVGSLAGFRELFPGISSDAYQELLKSKPLEISLSAIYTGGFFDASCSRGSVGKFLELPVPPTNDLTSYSCGLGSQAKLEFIQNTHYRQPDSFVTVFSRFITAINKFSQTNQEYFGQISESFGSLQTANSTEEFFKGIADFSQSFCPTKENDLSRIYKIFSDNQEQLASANLVKGTASATTSKKFTRSTSKASTSSSGTFQFEFCSSLRGILRNSQLKDYTNRILQFLNGKVIFYPSTVFTVGIMQKASEMFQNLFNLGKLLIEFNNGPRERIDHRIRTDPAIKSIRDNLSSCTAISSQCAMAYDFIRIDKDYTSPNNLHYSDILKVFSVYAPFIGDFLGNCIDHPNRFIGVSNVTLYEDLMSPKYAYLFGVRFDNLPQPESTYNNASGIPKLLSPQFSITYSYNPDQIDTTTNFKVLDEMWSISSRNNPRDSMKYLTSGLLDIQDLLDRSIISILTGVQGTFDLKEPTVTQVLTNRFLSNDLKMMPDQCYQTTDVASTLGNLIPFLLILSWIIFVVNTAKNIVSEKESGFKEFTKVMGISNGVHQISWLFVFFLSIVIISFIITAVLVMGQLFNRASFLLIFFINVAFGLAICVQTMFLSNFFSNANVSSVMLGIFYFSLYLPYLVMVRNSELPISSAILTFILPQLAYTYALRWLLKYHDRNRFISFGYLRDIYRFDSGLEIVYTILMLCMDSLIYGLLHWYFQELFPGPFGVRRPIYFPVTKSYWLGNDRTRNAQTESTSANQLNEGEIRMIDGEERYFEGEPRDLTIGVQISSLTKIYNNKNGPVVNELSVNFYNNQITAFLGHNGAGKTTTISILTGLYKASSGTAIVNGYNIAEQPEMVRKSLGYCPQHNILLPSLTVYEHIVLFGMIKGLTLEECSREANKFVNLLNFKAKIHEKTMNLSGGQKRKLNVCLSFIGNSRVVILDEPTAGVDPYSRRLIWDLILSLKEDRSIILTTHHMDEAEVLGDRIVIISEGRLQTSGSPVYLKSKYSDGYKFIFNRDLDNAVQNHSDEQRISNTSTLYQTLVQIKPDITIEEDTLNQVILNIPLDEERPEDFLSVLRHLASDKQAWIRDLGYENVLVSDFNLEDIFLKVAKDPSKKDQVDHLSKFRRLLSNVRPRMMKRRQREQDGTSPEEYQRVTGFHHYFRQFSMMIYRRYKHFLRNKRGWLVEILMPVLLVIFAGLIEKLIIKDVIQPRMNINEWQMSRKHPEKEVLTFYANEFNNNIQEFLVTTTMAVQLSQKNLAQYYRDEMDDDFRFSGSRCYQTALGDGFQPEILDYCYRLTSDEIIFSQKWPDNIDNSKEAELLLAQNCTCQENRSTCEHDFELTGKFPRRTLSTGERMYDFSDEKMSNLLLKMSRNELVRIFGGLEFKMDPGLMMQAEFVSFLATNNTVFSVLSYLSAPENATTDSYWLNIGDSFRKCLPPTSWLRVHFNNHGYTSSAAYLTKLHNLQLRAFIDPAKALSTKFTSQDFPNERLRDLFSIVSYVKPMDYMSTKTSTGTFIELTLVFFLIMALSFLPASFVSFLINERANYTKQLQIISGLNRNIYWVATWIWDCINYGITIVLVFIVFFAANKEAYTNTNNVGSFVIILLLYGPAVILMTYPSSFIFKSSNTAFVVMLCFNLGIGIICTVVTFVLDNMSESNSQLIPVNDGLKGFFLIFPQFCLGRGVFNLAKRYILSSYIIVESALTIDESGRFIIALVAHILVYGCLVILIENNFFWQRIRESLESRSEKLRSYRRKRIIQLANVEIGNDVKLEAERVKEHYESKSTGYLVIVYNLYKIFTGKKLPSVNQISFSVQPGECFGLLGINGAGKTTTFKMITSILSMTSGEIVIDGANIKTDLQKVLDSISYCPQFDAVHPRLTCRENLKLFAILKGVPGSHVDKIVDRMIEQMGLSFHAEKQSVNLSGGNRRKLSAAVALIRDPKLVLLDEPTSGMDPVAKRFLWDQIRDLIEKKKSVILTSHSMEECEALCNRIGIMVQGQFKSLGTIQDLKNRYGSGYIAEMRLNNEYLKQKEFINEAINGKFKEMNFEQIEDHYSILKYKFEGEDCLGSIFERLFELRREKIITSYSVFHTNLDHAFVKLSKEHDESEIQTVEVEDRL